MVLEKKSATRNTKLLGTLFALFLFFLLLVAGPHLPFSSSANIPTSFTVGPGPYGIVFNPSNGLLYVANTGGTTGPFNTLSAIDPITGSVRTITLTTISSPPFNLAYDSHYKVVYVATEGGGIYGAIVIVKGLKEVGTVGSKVSNLNSYCSGSYTGLYGIVYDSKNNLLYATCNGNGAVFVIQPASSTAASIVHAISLNVNGLGGITYDPADNLLYTVAPKTSTSPMQIVVINPSTYRVVHTITAPSWAQCAFDICEISYDPSGSMVVVGDSSHGEIACVNTKSFTISDCILSAGGSPGGFAYKSSSKLMYAANYFTNEVSAISGTRIIANYPLAAQPYMLAYDTQNGHIYATAGANSVYLVI